MARLDAPEANNSIMATQTDEAKRALRMSARRRVSRHGAAGLAAMLSPAVLFPIGLFLVRDRPGFQWLRHPSQFPTELWVIATTGVVATVGGVLLTDHLALLVDHGLALSGGVTLYVAASNLVPEFQGKPGWRLPAAFFAGAGTFYATRLLLGALP